MQMLYAHNQSAEVSYESIDKELQHSISKSHELYVLMMLLPGALKRLALKRIESGRNKIRPTEEERNPNLKFVKNRFIQQLDECPALNKYAEATGISWNDDEDTVKILLNAMTATDAYKEYMNSEEDSYENDRKFIIYFFSKELTKIDLLYESLEIKNVYWNDDIDFQVSIAVKTFKLFDENNTADVQLFPEYKDSDDMLFVKTLLSKCISTYDSTFNMIKRFSSNWDPERVAQMDVILIVMAAAEMMSFHEIPIKVTLNEYIEISKYYSTAKSNVYINGILEKIVRILVEDQKINATQLL